MSDQTATPSGPKPEWPAYPPQPAPAAAGPAPGYGYGPAPSWYGYGPAAYAPPPHGHHGHPQPQFYGPPPYYPPQAPLPPGYGTYGVPAGWPVAPYPHPQHHHPHSHEPHRPDDRREERREDGRRGELVPVDLLTGLALGAAAAYLLSNEQVQRGLMRSAVSLWGSVQGGFAEIKERFHDAEAEVRHAVGLDRAPAAPGAATDPVHTP